MPILSHETAPKPGEWSPIVRFPGLPDFNVDHEQVISELGSSYSRPVGAPVLVANGGGPGAVAIPQPPAERYLPVAGRFRATDATDLRALLGLIYAAFAGEAPMVVIEPSGDERQIFVMMHDTPDDPEMVGPHVNFTLPLVAADPLKYDLTPLTGTVGVFAGADWYRTYTDDGTGGWYRTYISDGAGGWYRTYAQPEAMSERPLAWGPTSLGEATSRRLVTTVHGPQEAGWRLQRSDAAGVVAEVLQVDLALAEGQTVTVDSLARTVRLGTADVSHLAFGDFPTLPPDASVFRLVAPTDLGGWADFEALPAYY